MKTTNSLSQIILELTENLDQCELFAEAVTQAVRNHKKAKEKLFELQSVIEDSSPQKEKILAILDELKTMDVVKNEMYSPNKGVFNLYLESELSAIRIWAESL